MNSTLSKLNIVVLLALTLGVLCFYDSTKFPAFGTEPRRNAEARGYAGSQSCRECHERFYQLWSTSFHGLAMQPYSEVLVKERLTPQKEDVAIGSFRYRAEIGKGQGWVLEDSPKGMKKYRIEHALGGKNVYYFLTPLEKGRLQTLPVAYDVIRKEWIDMAASGVRHFPGDQRPEEPLNWKEWPYTFNTACYSCHVSQLSTNYDLETDTYHTVWAEPGINCETCHGPSAEHNKTARETPKGQPLSDLKIISTKTMTTEQRNHLCASCHAKTTAPLTQSYPPGGRFYDHFDLITLENPDYYPDGRDLGENYTYTSWLMSPCVKSGKLDCMHCHTSSGRYRFKKPEDANKACLPCHEERVNSAPAHTRHEEESAGNKCISCHMLKTSFARMNRSDHSMLPPVPAASMAYQSPNACNICHSDKDAAWADRHVREWRPRDYQAPLLRRANLINAARKRDWSKLQEVLDYVTGKERDEVFAASLIRMITASGDPGIVPVLCKAINDPSPLVRAAAADALQHVQTRESFQALMQAIGDDYRLVRVRAAASLIGYKTFSLDEADKTKVEAAIEEYLTSIQSRPDQWTSHYNLGNAYLSLGDPKMAVASYDTALKLEPAAVSALVNKAMAYAQLGESKKAGELLQKALEVAPGNAAANFNMGLLKAEQEDMKGAERYLKAALKADPQMAQAAYNLCVITSKDRISEAVTCCRIAAELRPQEPRYAYTLAFYLNKNGNRDEAIGTLKAIMEKYPGYKDAEMLLRDISR